MDNLGGISCWGKQHTKTDKFAKVNWRPGRGVRTAEGGAQPDSSIAHVKTKR